MAKQYYPPTVRSEEGFQTSALACGKTATPPPGSWHFYGAYDTFTGHMGPALGVNESMYGQVGLGFGPAGTSLSYPYSGLCLNWVTLAT